MNWEAISAIGELIGAIGLLVSIFYLAVQINQQNEITRAQFGFSLSQRLYDRFFKTAQDPSFCELLSRDWANTELEGSERWQAGMYINTLFVDIFDTYDKIEIGMAEEIQLQMRMNLLKSGIMKLDQAKMLWNLWKPTRSMQFSQWFESEVFDGADISEFDLRESPHSTGVIR